MMAPLEHTPFHYKVSNNKTSNGAMEEETLNIDEVSEFALLQESPDYNEMLSTPTSIFTVNDIEMGRTSVRRRLTFEG